MYQIFRAVFRRERPPAAPRSSVPDGRPPTRHPLGDGDPPPPQTSPTHHLAPHHPPGPKVISGAVPSARLAGACGGPGPAGAPRGGLREAFRARAAVWWRCASVPQGRQGISPVIADSRGGIPLAVGAGSVFLFRGRLGRVSTWSQPTDRVATRVRPFLHERGRGGMEPTTYAGQAEPRAGRGEAATRSGSANRGTESVPIKSLLRRGGLCEGGERQRNYSIQPHRYNWVLQEAGKSIVKKHGTV
jgi:hypothetical protein